MEGNESRYVVMVMEGLEEEDKEQKPMKGLEWQEGKMPSLRAHVPRHRVTSCRGSVTVWFAFLGQFVARGFSGGSLHSPEPDGYEHG